jgi:hypothetical protein
MASKLEIAANAQRAILTTGNSYKLNWNAPSNLENLYSPTHTKALSDTKTPIYGKGTGVFLDTYNGGGDYDINGNANYTGSGRKQALSQNLAKWGFGPNNYYSAPDTSGNSGQYKTP